MQYNLITDQLNGKLAERAIKAPDGKYTRSEAETLINHRNAVYKLHGVYMFDNELF